MIDKNALSKIRVETMMQLSKSLINVRTTNSFSEQELNFFYKMFFGLSSLNLSNPDLDVLEFMDVVLRGRLDEIKDETDEEFNLIRNNLLESISVLGSIVEEFNLTKDLCSKCGEVVAFYDEKVMDQRVLYCIDCAKGSGLIEIDAAN